MNETVSIDSLVRFLRATPEQRAAVDRFLLGAPGELGGCEGPAKAGCEPETREALLEAVLRVERKVEALKHTAAAQPPINQGEAERIFAVLTKLRTETGVRKAPLHTVFEFMVMQGLSGEETARRCKCAPSLISARVRTLKERFGMPVSQLHHYASALNELETSVRGDKRRRKRSGLPDNSEGAALEEDGGDEPERGGDAGDAEGEDEA